MCQATCMHCGHGKDAHGGALCTVCFVCKTFMGRVTPSEVTDHITPVRSPDDPGFRLRSNLQALCKPCHSVKTCREDGGLGLPPRPR